MEPRHKPLDIVCFGGAVIDATYQSDTPLTVGTSNPCTMRTSYGGVARNVAETLALVGRSVGLVSALGNDDAGRGLLAYMSSLDVDVSGCLVRDDLATAQYAAVLDGDGGLHVGLAAMDAFDALVPAALEGAAALLNDALWVFADTNLPEETLHWLLETQRCGKLAVDAVSLAKAKKLPHDLTGVDVLFANLDEARALVGNVAPEICAARLLERGADSVVITLGADGHVVADRKGVVFVGAQPTTVINVTGAGDALIAGTVYCLLDGLQLVEASEKGARLAALTLASPNAVAAERSVDPC